MNLNYYKSKYKPVFLKGYVYYEDMTPVKNAIVLLEMVLSERERRFKNINSSSNYAYTKTNMHGEFCFSIWDHSHYYRLKIFDNDNLNLIMKETL